MNTMMILKDTHFQDRSKTKVNNMAYDDWMKDFDKAKKNEGRKTGKKCKCIICDKFKTLGDDGKCASCDLRSIKR